MLLTARGMHPPEVGLKCLKDPKGGSDMRRHHAMGGLPKSLWDSLPEIDLCLSSSSARIFGSRSFGQGSQGGSAFFDFHQ